ncbi:phosphoribosylpyrophosphate synthetase [Hymenobacter sp. UV11]|uniref:phosphoribosylpyrophosphate synthetase n=1 Tax=Hymenobacter sp. UV11 TaxID=1849735 RepID=UPI00105F1818|nr:phosphoribosylpyrophosphate synthetase [Hymenobacter sp. UV11]TDN36766.1 hypothetical protein A8B98_07185 [Hymenobacter sp. UV11]TFZ63701.1 phosphoribosylpyrophosphate synthetase [Hymenobacter sp. UV11]
METPVYDTLMEALLALRRRGYTLDYNLAGTVARCVQVPEELRPSELHIEEVHRFEGNSNPDDSAVLYALRSGRNPAHRGVLVAAYGPYVETAAADFIQQLDAPLTAK